MSRKESNAGSVGCGCLMAVLAFNLTLGGFCFDYVLWSIFGKDIPWYADMIAGLFLGEFAIPLTVICWIVRLCGIAAPFVS